MARRPVRSKPKGEPAEQPTSAFVDALKFVAVASKEVGAPNETHVTLSNQWAVSFNGVLAAGHRIVEDIYAAPHNLRLIDALSKCGENLAITQLDNGRLSLKSSKFRALVPCIDPLLLQSATPDPPVAAIDDRLKAALEAVGVLASEGAQHVVTASVLLKSGSVIATDRHIMFEAWHGIDLPPGLVLPKSAIGALTKKAKKLARLGFSASSVTFYFEDGSWIRSQLYSEPWPDVSRVLDIKCNPWPVPPEFFTALNAVASFSEDENVRFDAGVMRSHDTDAAGASYEVAGLPKGPMFNAKRLKLIEPYAKTIDFFAAGGTAMFFGDNMRGALVGTRR